MSAPDDTPLTDTAAGSMRKFGSGGAIAEMLASSIVASSTVRVRRAIFDQGVPKLSAQVGRSRLAIL